MLYFHISLQDNYGLDLIEVRDNGSGISPNEARHAALAHYTSKLCSHEDLLNVRSYGFRGEALSSLCCVADVRITSRTAQQDVAQQYALDRQGHVTNTKVITEPSIRQTWCYCMQKGAYNTHSP